MSFAAALVATSTTMHRYRQISLRAAVNSPDAVENLLKLIQL
jgi:hypothetical protein